MSEVKVQYDPVAKRLYVVNPSEVGCTDPSVMFAGSQPQASLQNNYRSNWTHNGRGRGYTNWSTSHGQRTFENSGARPKNRFPRPPQLGLVRCYSCNKLGHKADVCRSVQANQNLNQRSPVICYVCGKPGHVSIVCQHRKGPRPDEQFQKTNDSNSVCTGANTVQKLNKPSNS